jgi:hypothetical protein
MQLTRYYSSKRIEVGHIRALRDLLMSTFRWEFAYAQYTLCYPDFLCSVGTIDDADKLVAKHGQPVHVRVAFSSMGGRMLTLETRVGNHIAIDVDNKDEAPERILDSAEPLLGIVRLAEAGRLQPLRSAFIAHAFNDEGHASANELARFLSLVGLRCYSGRAFSLGRVSEKVNDRLCAHDLFFGIITPHEDHTWITQEISTATTLRKPVFVLKHTAVVLKMGLLGDYEYIPYETGAISKTFIPILEGINQISKKDTPLYPWDHSISDTDK